MHREFAAVQLSIETFVEQPDNPTLLIEMSNNDAVPVLKMLQALDQQQGDAIFLIFPFACNAVATYVQACIDALGHQVEEVNRARANHGEALWPLLPLACSDPRRTLQDRLREAVMHIRALVPEHAKVVWAWVPSPLDDAAGFANVMMQLLALSGFEDWMEGHRFCIRDDRYHPILIPLARDRKAEHVLILAVDFSSEDAARNLVGVANDEAQPIAQRMQALMQIAAIDLAHGRLPDAQRKYRALYALHAEGQDATGCAMALHGLGDIALRHGSQREAKEWYLRALQAGLDGRNLVVVINSLMAVGNCCSALGEHARSAVYFELASCAAGRLMLVHTKVEAMEKAGAALLACGNVAQAAESWIDAKGLCEQFGCELQHDRIVDRLVLLYTKAGLKNEARAYEQDKKRFRTPRERDAVNPARYESGS